MYKIYAIGPLPICGDVIGGTKVSFDGLVQALHQDKEVELVVQNSSRPTNHKNFIRRKLLDLRMLLKIVINSAKASRKFDVLFWNVSATALPASGLLFLLATRIGKAHVIIRVFGGDLDKVLETQQPWLRKVIEFVLFNFDAVLLQSKFLVNYFQSANRNVVWFPTTRNLPLKRVALAEKCSRFLYLGQLRPEKGIPEIIVAAKKLEKRVKFTICGPLMPGYNPLSEINGAGINYLEPIPNSEVSNLLAEHDALLFPSYYEGEGYPGVVIESFQSGMPVIATRWKSLPEIVLQDVNGILIEPRNSEELYKAILYLLSHPDYFHSLCKGAIHSSKQFNTKSAVNCIKGIVDKINLDVVK